MFFEKCSSSAFLPYFKSFPFLCQDLITINILVNISVNVFYTITYGVLMVAIVVARVVIIQKNASACPFLFEFSCTTVYFHVSVCRPLSCLRARKCYSIRVHRLFNWFPFGGHLGFLFQNFAAINIFIGIFLWLWECETVLFQSINTS